MRSCSRSPTPRSDTVAQIIIPVAERLGDNVVDFEHLNKGYGDNLLIEDLTFKLPPGGIVGVIGPNGAGKTTLFRMITGQEKPDCGHDHDRRVASSSAMSTSRAMRSTATRPSGRKFPTRRTSSCSARRK